MSPEQSRAARAWLDWSQDDLARKAQVSNSTIRDFEASRRVPIANNLTAIRRALEDGGVLLVFGDGGAATGIAARPQPVRERRQPEDLAPHPTPLMPKSDVSDFGQSLSDRTRVYPSSVVKNGEREQTELAVAVVAPAKPAGARPTFFIDLAGNDKRRSRA